MQSIRSGDKVVLMAGDGESIEVHTVVNVLADGIQVDGASGKLSREGLRLHHEETVSRIHEKEELLKTLKREIRSLFDSLPPVGLLSRRVLKLILVYGSCTHSCPLSWIAGQARGMIRFFAEGSCA